MYCQILSLDRDHGEEIRSIVWGLSGRLGRANSGLLRHQIQQNAFAQQLADTAAERELKHTLQTTVVKLDT